MIVFDCSAAMEMARNTSRGTGFRMLALKGERVVASDLIRAEIRSAAWRYVRADMMDEDEAMGIIDDALDLVDEFIPLEENAAEAFAEAVRQNRSVYDMFYLTLVRRYAATLFSTDRKLVELCGKMGLNAVREVPF